MLGAADALTSSLPLTSLPFFFVWYAVFREPAFLLVFLELD